MLEPSSLRERSPRRRALLILGILGLVMVLVVAGAGSYYVYLTGASGEQTPVSLTIPDGSTTASIAELLEDKGVIRSAFAFKMKARLQGIGDELQAGDYELTTNMTVEAVFEALKAGPAPVPTVTFGVPEGLRIEQVADRAAEALGSFKAKGFLKLAQGGEFSLPPYLPEDVSTVEGFLFPKVYEFLPNPSARDVIQKMLDQFEREVADLPWENAEQLGLTPYEIVNVAALIEREARVDEDRGKISRVIHNRLQQGMKLDIDATIQYIMNEYRPITLDERQIESPYNTYLHAGLPPTPIACPGLESIAAALEPTPGPWIYYLTVDDSGRHEFFESYQDFLDALNSRD